jgi:two-component system, LytTR family, sensor histidine kinase AlgZ
MAILPRELIYFYLIAPILMAPVFQRDIFELEPVFALRSIAGGYLPFLLIPAGLHAVYRWVWPARLRTCSLLQAVLLHAACGVVVAAAVAVAIHPVFVVIVDGRPPMLGFAAACVVLTWMFILPAIVVQELRVRAETLARRVDAERQATLRAQLEALQARTNPHFLFNALNTIASLVRDQPELAERTVERLADLLRYALHSGRFEHVPLEREIAMMRDYLEIQRARFGDRMRYSIEVEAGIGDLAIPPLVLQPLVENAILHGIAHREHGGSLRIAAHRRAGVLELCVEDDGPGPGHSSHRGSGTGLDDLRRRLELLYGGDRALTIRAGDRGGFRVDLALPVAGPE